MKLIQETVVTPMPSEELIKKHEKFWRLKLPESFVNYLKLYNGVEVQEATFECNNRTREAKG